MKKIPCNVYSLICASNQLNNHSKAVEELVYNALDARATSIAIRIDIQENTIQVIDNGFGVCSKDFIYIGQKYMTSKFIDLSTLKSLPNTYGYRGQSLANLTNVSKTLKVISRHETSEETWMKLFEYGKEKEIKMCSTRPSKGTTVEVNGFLYNLNIRNKSKDILNELQNIKTFLEHLSIVHSNISLSLRDDSKNEIIYKMHKNRDIYQTLSTLYNIEKSDFQELQVEKNEYKVTALLGKTDNIGKHLIFLNGKFISNASKLHKIVNNELKKTNMRLREIKKFKAKDNNIDEDSRLFHKKIPDYFIFVKCPYMDYDLSTSAQDLEFKDWNQMKKLLDKLIKFFNGNINFKETIGVEKKSEINNANNCETREQVKQIMEKILGAHSKKPRISHMHNGIKGKQVKRKSKKTKENVTTILNINICNDANPKITHKDISDDCFGNKGIFEGVKDLNITNRKKTRKDSVTDKCTKLGTELSKTYSTNYNKITNSNKLISKTTMPPQKQTVIKINKTKKTRIPEHGLARWFENMDSDLVKNKVVQRFEEVCKVVCGKNINSAIQNNISVKAICKQKGAMIARENNANAPNNKLSNFNNVCDNVKRKEIQSNYDLLQTILTSQRVSCYLQTDGGNNSIAIMETPLPIPKITRKEPELTEAMVTFQSHSYYYAHQNFNEGTNNSILHKKPRIFITKESRDNFRVPNNKSDNKIFKRKNMKTAVAKDLKAKIKRLFNQTSKLFSLKRQIVDNKGESSAHTIEFTKTDKNKVNETNFVAISSATPINSRKKFESVWSQSIHSNYSVQNSTHIAVNTNTYTISNIDNNGYTINNYKICGTYTIERSNDIFNESQACEGIICAGNSRNSNFIDSDDVQNEQIKDPINVCETVFNSQEILEKEFEFSFNNRQTNSSSNFIAKTGLQKRNNNTLYEDNQAWNDNEQCQKHNKCLYLHQMEMLDPQDIFQELSHHFILPNTNIRINTPDKVIELKNQSPVHSSNMQDKLSNPTVEKHQMQVEIAGNISKDLNICDFNLKHRLGFVPKGMSPIFENRQTKNMCEFNLDEDIYEDEMYDNFVENVRNNAEIFEPEIHEAKELTTKAIHKVNVKLNKNNSSLKFDSQSLKGAKVLGQIDEKFIAAILKEGCNTDGVAAFLVLFDQHAVHERIRLENNMSDYFNKNQWKSVDIDAVNVKLSKDDILYLHNYKDKFEQLGLRWTVLNTNEVAFSAIAEAILGKNPRQVDIVMKAVTHLITEEINVIKMQGGCVSLYPKSIMDLVFSEACRYAIKFGDKLSKTECVDLLKVVSDCKTPFQCAHGRPVMAVIMDVKPNKVEYKVNLNKIMEWKRKLKLGVV